ncbi:hypothetical protein BH20VER1_BH20VER1_08170 [soil metagenome]
MRFVYIAIAQLLVATLLLVVPPLVGMWVAGRWWVLVALPVWLLLYTAVNFVSGRDWKTLSRPSRRDQIGGRH